MKEDTPSIKKSAFNCPHCNAYAKQDWLELYADFKPENSPLPKPYSPPRFRPANYKPSPVIDYTGAKELRLIAFNTHIARCQKCQKLSIWAGNNLVFPQHGIAPSANADMPDDICQDYEEASCILNASPRGAAALLRLAIQKLCKDLCKEIGKPGKDLNEDIGLLVNKGRISVEVQQALDAVRVIGNNAVHPGQIDLRDNDEVAESLFGLLNLIVEKTISERKRLDEIYSKLPEGALEAIKNRDANS